MAMARHGRRCSSLELRLAVGRCLFRRSLAPFALSCNVPDWSRRAVARMVATSSGARDGLLAAQHTTWPRPQYHAARPRDTRGAPTGLGGVRPDARMARP